MNKRYAAIDLGSNTILMVIGELNDDKTIKIITDAHSIARLGEGVDKTDIVNNEAKERGIEIIKKYKAICDEHKVDKILALGTSALRDAKNGSDIIDEFRNILGGEVGIIPGNEEANLSFAGTVDGNELCTVIDIGGGSTEFITGEGGTVLYKKSLNIGAVRITEKFFSQIPPKPDEIMNAVEFIVNSFDEIDADMIFPKMYAVAGTPTTISAISQNIREFDYDKIHGDVLEPERISSVLDLINSTPLQEIIDKFAIHPKRADVIAAGTLILKLAMEYFRIPNCIVSAHGLRYGILKKMIKNDNL